MVSATATTMCTTRDWNDESLVIVSDNVRDWIEAFQECLANTATAATTEDLPNWLYDSKDERDICQKLVEALEVDNDDDLTVHAANTSYAYWYLSTQQLETNRDDGRSDVVVTSQDRLYAAMREARRHYLHVGRDFDKALKSMTTSCQYRKDHKIDLLRTCFDSTHQYVTAEDEALAKEMADLVRQDTEMQFYILRGQDRYGQSVLIKYPRTKTGTTERSYVLAQIYVAERSTASTEFLSRGKRERSVAVYNYLGFDRSASPGFSIQVAAATQVQQLYPERLQTLVFVEPPFWLKGLLALLKPFLAESITERIQWATGMEEREATFSKLMGQENNRWATPLMRKNGQLTGAVSLDHFFFDTPFFGTYDSRVCKRHITEEEHRLHELAHGIPSTNPAPEKAPTSFWDSINATFAT